MLRFRMHHVHGAEDSMWLKCQFSLNWFTVSMESQPKSQQSYLHVDKMNRKFRQKCISIMLANFEKKNKVWSLTLPDF